MILAIGVRQAHSQSAPDMSPPRLRLTQDCILETVHPKLLVQTFGCWAAEGPTLPAVTIKGGPSGCSHPGSQSAGPGPVWVAWGAWGLAESRVPGPIDDDCWARSGNLVSRAGQLSSVSSAGPRNWLGDSDCVLEEHSRAGLPGRELLLLARTWTSEAKVEPWDLKQLKWGVMIPLCLFSKLWPLRAIHL